MPTASAYTEEFHRPAVDLITTEKLTVVAESLHPLNREFMATAPDAKWTNDLPYLWTRAG